MTPVNLMRRMVSQCCLKTIPWCYHSFFSIAAVEISPGELILQPFEPKIIFILHPADFLHQPAKGGDRELPDSGSSFSRRGLGHQLIQLVEPGGYLDLDPLPLTDELF
jgi:hypothetical protein